MFNDWSVDYLMNFDELQYISQLINIKTKARHSPLRLKKGIADPSGS
jgi:hypothetical protein